MQLTSPAFLFLFFPLSLPLVLLLPKRHRRLSLSLLSLLFWVIANRGNLTGLIHILLLICFGTIMAYLPTPRSIRAARLRTTLSVVFPLLSFLAARLLCEYADALYAYPTGLLLATLGVISYAIDRARGDVLCPRNPLELMGYFVFFPTLALGPILRSKQYFDLTEEISFSPTLFTAGIRGYMLGYVKCLAIAAVSMRAVTDILDRSALFFHPVSLLLLLLLSYLVFYFFVTGAADMARGICAMYGICLPAQGLGRLHSAAPHALLQSVLPSLRLYLLDYVYIPLRHRFGRLAGRLFCALAMPLITVLIWRTRPEMLLFALPILICAGLCLMPKIQRFFTPQNALLRLLLSLCGGLLCSVFTLATVLEKPMDIFALAAAAHTGARVGFFPHAVFGAMQDAPYLAVLCAALLLFIPYAYLRPLLLRRARTRVRTAAELTETILLFAGFLLCALYFLPQFPLLAEAGFFRM